MVTRCQFARGVVLVLALALSISGCDVTGLVGGECAKGLLACDGMCVNLGSDNDNCGSCGKSCGRGLECRVGVCLPPGVTSTPPTSVPDDASVVVQRDAAADAEPLTLGSETSSTVQPSSTLDSGPSDPCFAPYNSAEHCGACGVECGVDAPFCAPVGNTFECVDGCEDPLKLCADRCVDTTIDPLHCGRCGNACPTGLCADSRCVGGSAGHVVAMCMSFEQLFSNSPQGVLLANAVFLATAPTVRVLVFDAYASAAARSGVRSVIQNASVNRGRPVTIDVAGNASEIIGQLTIQSHDVFLMADTSRAPAGALKTLGRDLSTTLDTFANAGGIVIISHGSEATQMVDFWGSDGSGLLDVNGLIDVTFGEIHNSAPGDSLAANVLTPFLALSTTCVYDMAMVSRVNESVVITGTAPTDGGGELPIVIHRVVAP